MVDEAELEPDYYIDRPVITIIIIIFQRLAFTYICT